MTEAKIRTQILHYLNSLPRSDFHVSPPGSHTGKPDIEGCLASIHVGIECKRPGYHPTKIQEYRMKKIRDAGGIAFCAHSRAEVVDNPDIRAILDWLRDYEDIHPQTVSLLQYVMNQLNKEPL